MQQTFREEYQTDNKYSAVVNAALNSLSFMLACMMLWMCIMLKILLLHLKSDFCTLLKAL